MRANPPVSIVLPTLNERRYIRDALSSLIAQDYPSLLEILVVDGGSKDGTIDIVRSVDGPIAVIANPKVTAASALNIGFAAAKGDIIVRADAHSLYGHDYVRRCVEVLHETGADNVGGLMRPVGATNFGRAVAAVTSSPLGVGPGRFHYSSHRQEVDTVYLGCWRRETLQALAGFDEDRLQWGAEDHELNHRLRAAGGRIVLDPTIHSEYFPRQDPLGLLRQYYNYGVGKASTLAKHHRLPSYRPLAPAALVAVSTFWMLFGRGWRRFLPLLIHSAVVGAGSLRLSDDPGVAPHRAFLAMEICHWSYGVGFWRGIARIATGRGFASSAPSVTRHTQVANGRR